MQRIKTVAPANQIVVWDFEQPTKVTLAFLICLLDTNDARLIEALHKYLIKTLDRPEMPISSHEIPGIDHEFSYHLDVQYELDLEAIRQTDGVLLIRPEDVPEEFYT
ncbi:MAG: hypothetical protein CVT70_19010 [Alphaproteobacteria bacterium HGW-Alphaproteobacteria-1]|nr:MAG: hypothetical protein CVT70_19010 [Alphaproteobacteria bacterium HGW-Alphaproteobacteria-1]